MNEISHKQYNLLSEEEKKKYVVSQWSSYRKVKKKEECEECGTIKSYLEKVPAKRAKPLFFQEKIEVFSFHPMWKDEINRYFINSLCSLKKK